MRGRKATESVDALRDAALDRIGEEPSEADVEALEEAVEEKVRKQRPVDPSVAALFPSGVVVVHEMISAASKTWREATDREAPSVDRLSAPGVVERIDVDALAGYGAVVTKDDTRRAFLPREQVSTIVALMLRRPIEEVARIMAEGPGPLTPSQPS
ncbi:MAG: hypothetical protein U0326_12750 [Polyangiales bacterium]